MYLVNFSFIFLINYFCDYVLSQVLLLFRSAKTSSIGSVCPYFCLPVILSRASFEHIKNILLLQLNRFLSRPIWLLPLISFKWKTKTFLQIQDKLVPNIKQNSRGIIKTKLTLSYPRHASSLVEFHRRLPLSPF